MRFTSAKLFLLEIPFAASFRHSRAERTSSASAVLRLEDGHGSVGYGEGLPRPYVTGETLETLRQAIVRHFWPAIAGLELPEAVVEDGREVLEKVSSFLTDPPGGFINPAARCATELAVLDTLLKSRGLSLGSLLTPVQGMVQYAGAISLENAEAAFRQARLLRLMGMTRAKVKIARTGYEDLIAAVRRGLGPGAVIGVDANGDFDETTALRMMEALAPLGVSFVEQPLPREDFSALRHLHARAPLPIAVDESLVTITDAEALVREKSCDIFNLRISKCGGLLRTLRIAELGRRSGLRLHFGCQVGETALLSAAGRHLAAHLGSLDHIEGSYGELLLREDLSEGNTRFGYGGLAPLLEGPGLGVMVREDVLNKYAVEIIDLVPP